MFFSKLLGLSAWLLFSTACGKTPSESQDVPRDPVSGLTALETKEVLVKVGSREITLGDYAATLLRMDRFERLRYQSEERQKQLLDEMIEVELLAQEARRLGLHKDPEVKLQMAQALRDELLQKLERDLAPASEISEREVRAYFDAHRAEFKEPERRRILAIQVGKKSSAEEVLKEAQGASGEKWGKLATKYSMNREKVGEREASELAGDLGFASAPGERRSDNDKLSDELRAAIFTVKKVGEVVSSVVPSEGSFYVLRLGGLSPARDRSLSDAERTIRVELRRQLFLEAEKKLEADLRKKYPVSIDEAALEKFRPALPNKEAPAEKTPGEVAADEKLAQP